MITLGLKKKGLKTLSRVEHQLRNANYTNSRCHFVPHRKLDAASYMKKEQDTWWTEAKFEGKRIVCLVKLNDWFTMQWGRFKVFRLAQLIFIPINNTAPLCTRHNVPELPTLTFRPAQLRTPGTSRCYQHKRALKEARPLASKLWYSKSTALYLWYLWGMMVTS